MSLSVYSSSAGSGKTTTLVNAYLSLALHKPEDFRHILAITFTNKAANEMKERVIEVLKVLLNDKEYPKNLQDLVENLNLERDVLKGRAKYLLSLILHNYDDFAISTIDSFIHRIIRTFAADVKLPQNFEVVIDDNDIIPDIISNLYDKVGHDHQLTSLLVDFVMSESEDEKSYDPTSRLIDFAKNQITEDGFQEIKKLDNLTISELTGIIKKLKEKKQFYRKEIQKNANKLLSQCSQYSLDVSDFKGGSRSGFLSYIQKVAGSWTDSSKTMASDAMKVKVENEDWYTNSLDPGKKNIIDRLSSALSEGFFRIQTLLGNHLFISLIYSKIYSLALINEIRILFSEFTNETGKVHISEFNKKISDEIAEQPIPFIYERLGRKFRYFLIDEFQDTSVLQWQNLLPLIDESLSYGNYNLLVGDAKQAIYRFRNGEVELFSSLPNIYNNDGSQISIERENNLKRNFRSRALMTNWRSYHEIIKFNNAFFETLVDESSNRTKAIYSNLKQELPSNKKDGGLVSIRFSDLNSEDSKLAKNIEVEKIIVELISKGYQPEHVCILCRSRNRAVEIATYLLEKNIDVVSSESLLLSNSAGVRLIIAFLKLTRNIYDEIALTEFVINYIRYTSSDLDFNEEMSQLKKHRITDIGKLINHFRISIKTSEIDILSVYEICELLYRKLRTNNYPDAFIQYFLDYAFENNHELERFLDQWDEKHESLFISMPENMKAVKIMTIHKSKGLDFPVVIVDAESKKNDNTKSEYWEDVNIKGIEELRTALIPINKNLKYIEREDIYETETSKTELDFINLIYVAFTRAKLALFAIGEGGKTKDRFSNYLRSYLDKTQDNTEIVTRFDYGTLPIPEKSEGKEESLRINHVVSGDWTELISVVRSKEVNTNLIDGKSSREYGNLIHNILSGINTKSDVQRVIDGISESGILKDSEIEIIGDIIDKVINNEDLKHLFEDGVTVKNETELLLSNGDIIRPDRVILKDDVVTIVDYKTGEANEKDKDQLRGYKQTFISLGYQKVLLRLVYIGEQIKVVSV